MKKEYKCIFFFILGAIIFGSISSVVAIQLTSRDIKYTKGNTEITVEQALNELYNTKLDLTSKTTANTNSNCYELNKVTAYIDGSDLLIRLRATKVVEDCNTSYKVDLSSLNLASITYKNNADFANSSIYHFEQTINGNTNVDLYVDSNYGYSEKQNYDYIVYYTFTR